MNIYYRGFWPSALWGCDGVPASSRFCFFLYPSRPYARNSWVLPVLKESPGILAAFWTWQLLHFALDLTITGCWKSLHFPGYSLLEWDWIVYKNIDFSVSQIWLQILALSLYLFTHAFTACKLLLMPRGTSLVWTDTLNSRSKYPTVFLASQTQLELMIPRASSRLSLLGKWLLQ